MKLDEARRVVADHENRCGIELFDWQRDILMCVVAASDEGCDGVVVPFGRRNGRRAIKRLAARMVSDPEGEDDGY